MAARQGHYMPVALLQSQYDALEEPRTGEGTIIIAIEAPPEEIVATIVSCVTTP